jgi:hypothetical protein
MKINLALLSHAEWLKKEGLLKEAEECRKQAYENNNFRPSRNRKNNNVVKSGGPIYTRRN